nr:MAG TPA: hypothetical protein [Caudoviricetes sp.]
MITSSYSINISLRILLHYNLFSDHRMITSNYHWLWSTGIGYYLL